MRKRIFVLFLRERVSEKKSERERCQKKLETVLLMNREMIGRPDESRNSVTRLMG